MYPVVILETTKDERKKLIIIVGLLTNRVSVELIDLLRTENCHRLMLVMNLSFLRIGWLSVKDSEPAGACRVRYGMDGIIMEFIDFHVM